MHSGLDNNVEARGSAGRRAAFLKSAAAVAIAAVAVPLLGACGPDNAAKPGAASVSAAPSSSAPAWRTDPVELPVFPLEPSWLPPGVHDPSVSQAGPNRWLEYRRADRLWPQLEVSVGPLAAKFEIELDGKPHRATVGGRSAIVDTASAYDGAEKGEKFISVRWKLSDKRTVQVASFSPLSEAQVLKFARGLRPGSITAKPSPITVAAVPPGLVAQTVSDEEVCFAPPSVAAREQDPRGLCATNSVGSTHEREATDLTIAGRDAYLNSDETLIIVRLGRKHDLLIDVDPHVVKLSREDFIRFAEGVRVDGK